MNQVVFIMNLVLVEPDCLISQLYREDGITFNLQIKPQDKIKSKVSK